MGLPRSSTVAEAAAAEADVSGICAQISKFKFLTDLSLPPTHPELSLSFSHRQFHLFFLAQEFLQDHHTLAETGTAAASAAGTAAAAVAVSSAVSIGLHSLLY